MSKEKKEEIDLDNLSEELKNKVIAQMREALKQQGDENADNYNRYELLRYLKARRLNVDLATTMFLNSLEWRKQVKLDQIKVDPKNGPFAAPTRGFKCVHDQDPVVTDENRARFYRYHGGMGFHKFDKQGHVVYYERIGLSNAKLLAKHVTFPLLLEIHLDIQTLVFDHLMKEASENQNKEMDTMTMVIDLQGLGLNHFVLSALKLLKALTDVDQLNYPERLNKMYWVNAPRIFKMFYDFGKNWVDERVLSKFKIVPPSETREVLIEVIGAENLPEFLGGSCTCSHMKTGCIPSFQLSQKEHTYDEKVTVYARSKHVYQVTVDQENMVISYGFKTIYYDIAFFVTFKGEGADEEESIVERKVLNCSEDSVEAIIECGKRKGVYTFTWDNAYSMLRSKELHFSVAIEAL